MADVKLSAFTVTSDSNGIVPIFITPGANNAINLRDAILAIASGGLVYKGLFDASTETDFPSGTEGDMYVVNNTGANPSVVNGISLSTGDQIIANTTGAVGVPANWDVIPVITSPDSTELIKGITAYATTVETEARAIGTKAVVPSALANFVLTSELLNQEATLVTYRVQMIFDDVGNDLPAVDTTTIDGQTVVTGDLVYVKNSSNAGKVDSVYSAVVTAGNIVWTYEYTVGTNAVYAEDGTTYGDTVLMDTNVAYYFEDLNATNIVAADIVTEDLTVNNAITTANYNQNYDVRLIFDDVNNSLPLADSTQIDGVTVVSGDLVYVKNSATPGEVGNIYAASVNTGVITWTNFAAPKDGDTIYSQEGTVYGDTTNDYSDATVTNISNLATESIISNNYNLNYNTRLIFDDATADLPLADSTQIDGVTVVDGDLVYVKEALDANTEGKIYTASVSGGVITWTLTYTLKDGETITVSEGTIYGDTINTQGDTLVHNITNLATEKIITENYNLNYKVDLVFNDGANDLPATNATLIDGQTLAINTTYLVYVKDALTASTEQKIHEGVVDGAGNIVWTELYALQIGDTYYASIGDVFGDTINNNSTTTINNGSTSVSVIGNADDSGYILPYFGSVPLSHSVAGDPMLIGSDGFLYTGVTRNGVSELLKINVETMQETASLSIGADGIVEVSGYLYALDKFSIINKIDISNFTIVDNLATTARYIEGDINGLYLGDEIAPGTAPHLRTVNLTTFTLNLDATISGADYLYGFTSDATYLYFTVFVSSTYAIRRYTKSALAYGGAQNVSANTTRLVNDGTTLRACDINSTNTDVVDLATFLITGTISGFEVHAVSGDYLYGKLSTSDTTSVKMNKTTQELASYCSVSICGVFDSLYGYAPVANTTIRKIVK